MILYILVFIFVHKGNFLLISVQKPLLTSPYTVWECQASTCKIANLSVSSFLVSLYIRVFIFVHEGHLLFINNLEQLSTSLYISWKFQDSLCKTANFSKFQTFLVILYIKVFIIVHISHLLFINNLERTITSPYII